ncbi:MAG: LLM class F420-dependent oxidoreductase [Rhodospirillaceae bacterium]|nr:LLM class F420-dependent oxidoreductase [Rhodospirillaceae bacterium]
MRTGLVFPQTEISDDPDVIREFAQTVEAEGFDYMLAYDHVLGVDPERRPEWDPLNVLQDPALQNLQIKRAPYDHESRFQEPMVLYAFLSAITSRIELATGVVILPQRQTALIAKQAANVANLSKGRLRLGVGIGWNDAEYEALGQNFKTRGRRMEEQLVYLRQLWNEETVTFTGEFDRIKGAGINPRPKQPIPLWLGGTADIVMQRAARLADGWQPSVAAFEAKQTAAAFKAQVEVAGRNPDDVGLENLIQCGSTTGGPVVSAGQAAETANISLDAGFSHVCISTLDAGHRTIDEHLEYAIAWRRLLQTK